MALSLSSKAEAFHEKLNNIAIAIVKTIKKLKEQLNKALDAVPSRTVLTRKINLLNYFPFSILLKR